MQAAHSISPGKAELTGFFSNIFYLSLLYVGDCKRFNSLKMFVKALFRMAISCMLFGHSGVSHSTDICARSHRQRSYDLQVKKERVESTRENLLLTELCRTESLI